MPHPGGRQHHPGTGGHSGRVEGDYFPVLPQASFFAAAVRSRR